MNRWARIAQVTMVTSGIALALGCASASMHHNADTKRSLVLAPSVDLDRYMGRWYVIANIPYFAERGFVGSYVQYSWRADGSINDVYYGHKKSFDAKLSSFKLHDYVVSGTHGAQWTAYLFWPIKFPYPILYVDAQYRYALVGYPDRSKAWIFSRTPELDASVYQDLLARSAAEGYDPSQFKRIPQTPAQIMQIDFQ